MRHSFLTIMLSIIMLSACGSGAPEALGTLEWDRINGRAIASEVITEVYVQEGDFVSTHQALIKLDDSLQQAHVKKLAAAVEQARWQVRELESGYRSQEIASAKAELNAKTISRKNQQVQFQRQKDLRARNLNSQRQLDDAEQRYKQALGAEEVALQKLNELESGYRVEEIEQARANFHAIEAEHELQQLLLSRYIVYAERAGKVDSLPFKQGDKPPINAIVSTILAGDQPWARVYIPETWLSQLNIGSEVMITVDGITQPMQGKIRTLADQPSFTPYYALSEHNRSRLMFVAQIDILDSQATDLPLGIPVQMQAPERIAEP